MGMISKDVKVEEFINKTLQIIEVIKILKFTEIIYLQKA